MEREELAALMAGAGEGQIDRVLAMVGAEVGRAQAETEGLRGEVAALNGRLADQAFDGAVERAVTAARGRNVRAIRALLDVDALKAGGDVGAAVAAVKAENGYLFEGAGPAPYAAGTGTAVCCQENREVEVFRAAAGV